MTDARGGRSAERAVVRAIGAVTERAAGARGEAADALADALARASEGAAAAAIVGAFLELALRVVEPDDEDIAALGALAEASAGVAIAREPRLSVRASSGRRTTGTHYTPAALAASVTERALAPLLARAGDPPSSADVLALRVADPAMGAGAFLLAALDVLSSALDRAWRREGTSRSSDDARRAVATRCLFGIDKSLVAARVARRSIALAARLDAGDERALERSLVVGDALVGLGARDLAIVPRARDLDATLAADVLVGAFFAHRDAAARAREAARRAGLLERWAASRSAEDDRALRSMQREARAVARPFHAELVWPRVHAVLGNPPFLGGKRISTELGPTFADWARTRTGSTKNADLAAHFLRRADELAADVATISFITTNSVAEGDTRRSGLAALLDERGYRLYAATRSAPWPGDAAVFMSIVHLGRGLSLPDVELDGDRVDAIDSRLRSGQARPEPARLDASRGVCFIGCFLRGRGFVLDAEAAAALVARAAPAERDAVRPFLGGEEVNTSPTQSPHRFVIDLAHVGATPGTASLDEARARPTLLAHLEREVRPERDALPAGGANTSHRARWWLFANARPELRAALRGLSRCLVVPRVSPRLNVAFQPTDRAFSDQLCVFALDGDGHFAILQSRVHAAWARRHASTLGEGLRYTPSTCLETFPFPLVDPRATTPALDRAGRALHARRAEILVELGIGLTALGRRLEAPEDRDPRVEAIRALSRDVDAAVLDAYGWSDLARASPTEGRVDELVIDRLLALNEARRAGCGPSSARTTSRAESSQKAEGGRATARKSVSLTRERRRA